MLDATKPRRKRPVQALMDRLIEDAASDNLAADMDEDERNKIAERVVTDYDIDQRSREDWLTSAERAMDVALQVRTPKTYPFEGASNVKYPLVTVAALQFGARAYPAIVDGPAIVKGKVIGADQDGQKARRAERIARHMSYQLLHEMEEWEEDTDVLLHHLPIVGCAFRKIYRSETLGRNKSEMVPAIHLVVNASARTLDEAPRITHEIFMYRREIEERQRSGEFVETDIPVSAMSTSSDQDGDEDGQHPLLEQHRWIDRDEDGLPEPYIATVHKDSRRLLRLVACYNPADIVFDDDKIIRIPRENYFVKYSFLTDPRGGFYDIGFAKLLESLSETIDTAINQMLDAGHLQNAGGGFVGSGLRLKRGEIGLTPGKYVAVDAPGNDIRAAIVPMQFPGPSAVLFQLLGMMVEAARDITAVKDIMTGDSGERVQTATTTLALIEQGLKVFSAIYKRIYRALTKEMKLLFRLNARYLAQQAYTNVTDDRESVAREDYDVAAIDVMPVADPKMVTDMQRAARANALYALRGDPLVNGEAVLRRVFEAIGERAEDFLAPQQAGPDPMQMAAVEAELKTKEARAAKDAAAADKMVAETEAMTAGRDAAAFGDELNRGLAGLLAPEAA